MCENQGKGKWDGAGGYFARVYGKDGVQILKHNNRDLNKFADWFNANRSLPKYCQKVTVGGTPTILSSVF